MMRKYSIHALTGAAVFLIGVMAGNIYEDYLSRPKAVYTADLDGDNRQDVVVENKKGWRFVFLQRPDGSYRPVDEVLANERATAEARANEDIKGIEVKIAEQEKAIRGKASTLKDSLLE